MRKMKWLVLSVVVLAGLSARAEAQCATNFNSTSGYNVGAMPSALASGDFNRDGRLDIAVVNNGSNNVSILLNQGASFESAGTYDTAANSSDINVTDFDNDGKLDIGVTNQNSNSFTFLYGDGLGGFINFGNIDTPPLPSAFTFADFNRDGGQDLAIMSFGATSILVVFGDGNGGYLGNLTISHTQFRGGSRIVAADINLDGRPDIVATGILNSGGFDYKTVISALGNSTGGFAPFNFLGATGWVAEIADLKIADFNRDGKPDYVVSVSTTFQGDVRYTVALGDGTGAFPQGTSVYDTHAFGGRTSSTAVGDFNADGRADLALSQDNTDVASNVYILNGNGTAVFPPSPRPFSTGGGNAERIITADFNGDGKPDIASTSSLQNKVNVTLNTCGGLTTKPKIDFDGDGKTDLSIFRPSMGEWWYLRSSDGANRAFQFGSGSDRLTPGDFTGDGKIDIAFFRPSTGYWFVLRSEDTSFYSFPFGTNGDIPSTGDYDGDGKTDAAIFRPSNSTWYINRSAGGTTIVQFGQAGDVPVPGD